MLCTSVIGGNNHPSPEGEGRYGSPPPSQVFTFLPHPYLHTGHPPDPASPSLTSCTSRIFCTPPPPGVEFPPPSRPTQDRPDISRVVSPLTIPSDPPAGWRVCEKMNVNEGQETRGPTGPARWMGETRP